MFKLFRGDKVLPLCPFRCWGQGGGGLPQRFGGILFGLYEWQGYSGGFPGGQDVYHGVRGLRPLLNLKPQVLGHSLQELLVDPTFLEYGSCGGSGHCFVWR